jgi:hypothetical protein
MEGSRFAGLPARCVPPSGFGYPRDGLLPSRPWPAFFRAGSARGIRPSELPPSKRYSARFRVEEPTYCLSRLYTLCRSIRPAGRPQFLGLALLEVPGDPRVFSTSTAGCSLGLFAFEGPSRKPWPGFRPTSSHALSTSRSRTAAPQSFDQLSFQPHPPLT